jgi:Citrate synthase, C-terminal domain
VSLLCLGLAKGIMYTTASPSWHCKMASKMCREDPLLEIAVELEKIATQDEYFVKRGLYPNASCCCDVLLDSCGLAKHAICCTLASRLSQIRVSTL